MLVCKDVRFMFCVCSCYVLRYIVVFFIHDLYVILPFVCFCMLYSCVYVVVYFNNFRYCSFYVMFDFVCLLCIVCCLRLISLILVLYFNFVFAFFI